MALSVEHRGDELFLGDESHLDASARYHFAEMIFRLLSERPPLPAELKVFELILNLAIDHGPETPSARAAIAKAKAGGSIGEAVAAGIREISDVHGGAQELCMPLLYRMVKEKVTASVIITECLTAKRRVPGFGHRLYVDVDLRAELIIRALQEDNLGVEYIAAIRSLGRVLAQETGKKLPLNIDGAIAAALCSFDWSPALGKAVFIAARTPGLCARYLNSGR